MKLIIRIVTIIFGIVISYILITTIFYAGNGIGMQHSSPPSTAVHSVNLTLYVMPVYGTNGTKINPRTHANMAVDCFVTFGQSFMINPTPKYDGSPYFNAWVPSKGCSGTVYLP